MKLTMHTDPGHGWLEMDRTLLVKLCVGHLISKYSYQRGEKVYLEEDCDMPRAMDALKAAGINVTLIEAHTERDSRVRHYDSYQFNGYI